MAEHRETFLSPLAGLPDRSFCLHGSGELVSDVLRRDGTWEAVESALFLRALGPGAVVVDAGANLGWHAVWAACRVGPSGRVYAFEPDPRNFQLLKANGEDLPQLRSLPCALGEARGTATFRRHGSNQGDTARVPEGSPGALAAVPLWSGDGLALGRLDFLKIDTQGSEVMVLAGFRETLRRHPHARLLVEFWPAGLARLGQRITDLQRSLQALARPIHLLDHQQGGLYPLSPSALAALGQELERSGGFSQLWLGLPPP